MKEKIVIAIVIAAIAAPPRRAPRPIHAEWSPPIETMYVTFDRPIYLSPVMPEANQAFRRNAGEYHEWIWSFTPTLSADGRTIAVRFSLPSEGPGADPPVCSYDGGGLLRYGSNQSVPAWSGLECRDAE